MMDVTEEEDPKFTSLMMKLRELRNVVEMLGERIPLLGTKGEYSMLRSEIKKERRDAQELCQEIEDDIRSLHTPVTKRRMPSVKRVMSGYQFDMKSGFTKKTAVETTDESERKSELKKIDEEFLKIKKILNSIYFTKQPLNTSDPETSIDSNQLSLSQLKELQIDFDKDQKELVRDLEELQDLMEEFNGILQEQKEFLAIAEKNTESSESDVSAGTNYLSHASKIGAVALPIVGGSVGAIIGGPIGAIVGVKGGLMLSGAAAGIGAGVASGMGIGWLLKKRKEEKEAEWEPILSSRLDVGPEEKSS
eukprot:TRINITY_DN1669_c0_g1_i1.p1 TRINITY_DN1669_c0_g1~~TRINITY_DN1669_c0_g1_i1.p1  ORF type:complete len:306 (+),score=83.39 TRINITY_DN1669_c0_g1_i1:181-1098(+)